MVAVGIMSGGIIMIVYMMVIVFTIPYMSATNMAVMQSSLDSPN